MTVKQPSGQVDLILSFHIVYVHDIVPYKDTEFFQSSLGCLRVLKSTEHKYMFLFASCTFTHDHVL